MPIRPPPTQGVAVALLDPFQSIHDLPWVERVIPLGTYGMGFNLESFEIFTLHLLPSLIDASVQEGFDFQPGGCTRAPNIPQHNFQGLEGLALPIRADVAEQAMLDWVPL